MSGQLVPDIIAEFIEQVVEIIVKGSLQHRLPAATVEVADVMQGMIKSSVFAVNIALVGACNGFKATAGAEGVGRATTRSVVLSIVYIILIDAVFTYFMYR